MQSFSFPFPLPTKPFSPFKPHKLYSSMSISSAQNKRNQSNRPKFPKVLTTNVNFTSKESLPGGLQPEFIPKHVAVIMDGNRRWAVKKGLAVELGYRAGQRLMNELARLCSKCGVKVLTFFCFFNRKLGPTSSGLKCASIDFLDMRQEEVDFLMIFLEELIESDLEDYMRENMKTSIIGETSKLPEFLQKTITFVEETTKDNTGLHVMIALNYSGRQDILQAAKKIASKIRDGEMVLDDINEKLFEEGLQTNCTEFPNPDLLIRTSGEQRVSNCMLWQLAYTELFFVDKLFPDFDEADLINVFSSFQRSPRRFGGCKY